MNSQKFRWSKVYESSEEELITFLRSRNLQFQRIVSEEPGMEHQRTAAANLTVWCAEGSLALKQTGMTVSLQPGDAIKLDGNQDYSLRAGMTGYVCYITDTTA